MLNSWKADCMAGLATLWCREIAVYRGEVSNNTWLPINMVSRMRPLVSRG